MCYFIDILANPCTCRYPPLKIAVRRATHVETVLFVSRSDLVGWVSRTREGGKNAPACLSRRFARIWPDQREAEHMCYF